MNPSYGIIVWLIIGALAGWIGSKIMRTDPEQGALANIVFGVLGALLGGWLTTRFLADNLGNNGLIVSFLVALFGATLLIFAWKMIRGGMTRRGRLGHGYR